MANDKVAYQPSHVGLCVTDVEASIRFYCEGLGFELAERYDMGSKDVPGLDRALEVDAEVEIVSQFVKSGPMQIELLGYTRPGTVGAPSMHRNQLGLTHLSFYVEDVDAAAARLVELGGTVLTATRANAGVDILFVADPDGTRVELMSPPPA